MAQAGHPTALFYGWPAGPRASGLFPCAAQGALRQFTGPIGYAGQGGSALSAGGGPVSPEWDSLGARRV